MDEIHLFYYLKVNTRNDNSIDYDEYIYFFRIMASIYTTETHTMIDS